MQRTARPGRAAEPEEGVARDVGQLLGCGALSPEETPPAALGTAGIRLHRQGPPAHQEAHTFPEHPLCVAGTAPCAFRDAIRDRELLRVKNPPLPVCRGLSSIYRSA